MLQILFPSDALNPARVDEHFASQATASQSYALVDMDALRSGDKAFRRLEPGIAIYRGWMLTVADYALLEESLKKYDVRLVTSTKDYLKAHHFTGWYDTFQHLTPQSAYIDPTGDIESEVARVISALGTGPYIVKDYVKSQKHAWDTACYAAGPARLPGIVREFIRLQDDWLVGQVVVRQFEEFTGAEARVWWVDGEVVVITAHPDTPDLTPEPILEGVREAVQALGCLFVTTDLAQRLDGSWRVIEVGDGQVSDFPISTGDFTTLTSALYALDKE